MVFDTKINVKHFVRMFDSPSSDYRYGVNAYLYDGPDGAKQFKFLWP